MRGSLVFHYTYYHNLRILVSYSPPEAKKQFKTTKSTRTDGLRAKTICTIIQCGRPPQDRPQKKKSENWAVTQQTVCIENREHTQNRTLGGDPRTDH